MTTGPTPEVSTAELEGLRDVAIDVAVEAAGLVKERARGRVEVADAKSSKTDVVTAVDRESEALLRTRLGELRPADGFLGEEGGGRESASGITWVVDPIDGTVNYLYGIPQYAVSVAAVDRNGRSLAGAVVNVELGEVFAAALGLGATLDGAPIHVRDVVPLSHRLVVTGFQYQEHLRRLQGAAVASMIDRVRDVRRMGSAALDICSVAAGRADAYVEEGLHLWDRAAAQLVATEAGAVVEVHPGVGGMDLVVCAPRDGYAEFWQLVWECGFAAGR